jgi:hypothetical protein
MSAPIDLFIDIRSQPGRLVGGFYGGTSPAFREFFEYSELSLRVFPVLPTGLITGAQFAVLPDATFADVNGLQLAIGARAGEVTPWVEALTWTKQTTADADGRKNYLYATVSLDTSELLAALGSASSITGYLEIQIFELLLQRTILQVPVTISSSVFT